MSPFTVYQLTVLSFVLGGTSVGLFSLAVSTDFWLTTREKMIIPGYPDMPVNNTVPLWLKLWTGLWRFCLVAETTPDEVNCMGVSYEDTATGRGEQYGLTSITIISAARRSVALPVSSLILSVIAVIFTVVGNIRKDARTLVGGVFFILSGLSLAVGMILYISAINDEVGYRVSTSRSEVGFSYAYGWSFFTAGFGFLASEMAAVVTVTLFLKRNSKFEDMARIIPGLEDKIPVDGPEPHPYREDRRYLCHPESGEDHRFQFGGGLRNMSVSA
ncbi:voltage-dependent calcium channel gamma-5 subunit-like [Physella acuta]|uniref:voltage-dependent calcium channel gamma-5 subunit-like n=1 Tax=Physella acuta TaxID=109671 RepID=UPI0027DCCC13|nr:voltage-dependent calcium channel gamma-5 subunit-like [Physella acuta]